LCPLGDDYYGIFFDASTADGKSPRNRCDENNSRNIVTYSLIYEAIQ